MNKEELKSLDEALDYLNEGILGAVAAVVLVPVFATAFIGLVACLARFCRKSKIDKMISRNPEVTKEIKQFAIASQKQILSLLPSSVRKYLKSKPISNISSSNIKNNEVSIVLFENTCFENNDYYQMTAEYIYNNMDDDEKEEKGLSDGDLSDIIDNPNYFEDGWDNIYNNNSDLENTVKDYDKEAYNAYKSIEDAVNRLSKTIASKIKSKSIKYECDSLADSAETDFNESYITLKIKFIDYSTIYLPDDIKEEISKKKNN